MFVAAAVWLVALATVGPKAAMPQQAATGPAASAGSAPADYQPVVRQYCMTCHNERLKTAGLLLDEANFEDVVADAQVWEKVVRKLRLGAMPPQGMPRPDEATIKSLLASLEGTLDAAYQTQRNPGPSPVHRLNRAEYRNAIRELLDLDVDVEQLLPADDSSYGFDNISDVLRTSPLLVSRYLVAAEKISAVAVGDPDIAESTSIWPLPIDESQNRHVPGMPLGTIGGIKIHYNFPLDAEYDFKTDLWDSEFGGTRGLGGLEKSYQFEVTVDGELVYSAPIGGEEMDDMNYRSTATAIEVAEDRMSGRLPIKAGPHEVTFQLIPPSTMGLMQEHLQPAVRTSFDAQEIFGAPRLTSILISGPVNPTGSGDTPSRRKIFICHPTDSNDELACATRILSTIARRAYGRALTTVERDELLDFYQRARADRPFEGAIQAALPRIISGPEFLIRNHPAPTNVADGAVYQVTDAELASRLALFLWSSIPDDELLALATRGELRNPEVLEQQVRRMLADPRSDALVTNFAGQWLWLRNLPNVAPDMFRFPEFDDNLRQSFLRETELFFGSIVQEDRPVLDLLNADYTFVNGRLAKHYGIPNVYGPRFRRVRLTDENRRGLLGQGSFLTVTGVGTAPVDRGKWVLTQLLNDPPPPPPPAVPALEESESGVSHTVRQMLEVHRKNAPCSTCHRMMDPIGLALENFNAVGEWRATDRGEPIDASTTLYNGEKVTGPAELRKALLNPPEVFVGTLAEKMMTYALGRGVDYNDMPAIRTIVRDAARNDYRFSSLIFGIVESVPFQMRVKQTDAAQTASVR